MLRQSRNAAAELLMIDYHLHTPLCHHAQGPLEAYVHRAIKLGLKEICFLDHLTVSDYGKELSMRPDELPEYLKTIRSLKDSFRGAIAIKVGLEIDFNPEYTDLYRDIVRTYAFDVIGSSVHFPEGVDIVRYRSDWNRNHANTDETYRIYLDAVQKMLACDYFDVICHLDLIKKFGHKPSRSFQPELSCLLSVIKKKNLAVEVNTSGINHPAKEMYPSPQILEECFQRGIPLTLGSDAHQPENVGRYFSDALSALRSIGFRDLMTFTGRQPHRISL